MEPEGLSQKQTIELFSKPVHIFTSYFLMMHPCTYSNISQEVFEVFQPKFCMHLLFPYAFCVVPL